MGTHLFGYTLYQAIWAVWPMLWHSTKQNENTI